MAVYIVGSIVVSCVNLGTSRLHVLKRGPCKVVAKPPRLDSGLEHLLH